MDEKTTERLSSKTSARSAGIFLILLSIPFAIATNRETPILAAGMLPCGILFCLASTEFAHRWRLLPPLLVLAGMCSCTTISVVGLQKGPLIRKSKEGATKENVGVLRSGLAVYHGNTGGNFPMSLEELMPNYLKEIPLAKTPPHHKDTNKVTYYSGSDYSRKNFHDTGGWGYVNDSTSPAWGKVFVDCTHTDSKGSIWTSY